MNISKYKLKLQKMTQSKLIKVCYKMKVKCNKKDTKKPLIDKLLHPLIRKYRMKETAEDLDLSVLKIGKKYLSTSNNLKKVLTEYEYLSKHIENLDGTPQLTIGLPLKDLPRLFQKDFMQKAFQIGPQTENPKVKSQFKTLHQNMDQLFQGGYSITKFQGTEAYGLAVLANSYINMFVYDPDFPIKPFDSNTGMKGFPLFMSRNAFSDLYISLGEEDKTIFKQFVKEAEQKIPTMVLSLYLDPEKNCGHFYLPVIDWLNSIIDPELDGKRFVIIDRYIQERFKKCNFRKNAKKGTRGYDKFSFRDMEDPNDFMSPPIPYIYWKNQRDEKYSMGALPVEHINGQIQVLLECRACIGGKSVSIDAFERYGLDFINFYYLFASMNPFKFKFKNYTIGFEYELSKGRKQTNDSTYFYKQQKMDANQEVSLGTTGKMHYDYSAAAWDSQEFVSYPANIEDAKISFFINFIREIILFNFINAMKYFKKKSAKTISL